MRGVGEQVVELFDSRGLFERPEPSAPAERAAPTSTTTR
jgi:hypothetical protein